MVGENEGAFDGLAVGLFVGLIGLAVGDVEGLAVVGDTVGWLFGEDVGALDGLAVGAAVGWQSANQQTLSPPPLVPQLSPCVVHSLPAVSEPVAQMSAAVCSFLLQMYLVLNVGALVGLALGAVEFPALRPRRRLKWGELASLAEAMRDKNTASTAAEWRIEQRLSFMTWIERFNQ